MLVATETISNNGISAVPTLADIERLDAGLAARFRGKLHVESRLTRQLVSFQANKGVAAYRWYKYKEAFSSSLIEHLLRSHGVKQGKILDPFAGMGTALFVAAELGLDADGIELLPIGHEIINTRLLLENSFTSRDFEDLRRWWAERPWCTSIDRVPLKRLRITDGAYPPETVDGIERYLAASRNENERVRTVLLFALLCILESISYTRKDGQYLRWDDRSGRRWGTKPFNKGPIPGFDAAITAKLEDILVDAQGPGDRLQLFYEQVTPGKVRLLTGSCLEILPTLPADDYSAVVTSPPYCNRYDYTRTYALELALLDVDEKGLVDLRQRMLSCTVESRAKDLLKMNAAWVPAVQATDGQVLIQSILRYLEHERETGTLNNNGIPRMVRGYFYEMACVIAECHRVLRPGGLMFVVNDNVRYAGAGVSVDLILSDIAERLGFYMHSILVLPPGKGNSSQQMGEHGRVPLRKCVYVWRKGT